MAARAAVSAEVAGGPQHTLGGVDPMKLRTRGIRRIICPAIILSMAILSLTMWAHARQQNGGQAPAAAQEYAPGQAVPQDNGAPPQIINFTVEGVQRQAMVFVPNKAPASGKVPVVFGFHWHGGTMQEDAQVFAFQKYWPEAIVVYMQGLPG